MNPVGTTQRNVSSASTQMQYAGLWRSQNDTIPGLNSTVYVAYSNQSDAAVTFNFLGVGATYLAVKKYDRGLAMLTLDNSLAYTVDCYDDSQVPQTEQILWQSPVLPYGRHNITLSQIGPDARIGFYPYLYTETWVEVVPTNVASYVATQALTTATNGAYPTSSFSPIPGDNGTNVAAIAGGVVGGVIALVLFGFLFYMYRRDKKKGLLGGSSSSSTVSRVKKSDEKMAIDDARGPLMSHPAGVPYALFNHPYTLQQQPQQAVAVLDAYGQPIGFLAPTPLPTIPEPMRYDATRYDATRYDAQMYDYSSESTGDTINSGTKSSGYRSAHIDLDSSVPASTSRPNRSRTPPSRPSLEDPFLANRSPRSYPYVQQGFGSERRTYPVPEI